MGLSKLLRIGKLGGASWLRPQGRPTTSTFRRDQHEGVVAVSDEDKPAGGSIRDDGAADDPAKRGVALGAWEGENGIFEMTESTKLIDTKSSGKIAKHLTTIGSKLKLGKAVLLTDVTTEYPYVAVGNVGPKAACFNKLEDLDELKENIRWGLAAACHQLHRAGAVVREIDTCSQAEAAGEAQTLVDWSLKVKACAVPPTGEQDGDGAEKGVKLLEPITSTSEAEFLKGQTLASAQNWARYLSDMPANHMTPIDLAQIALDVLCPLGVNVVAHDRGWIKAQRMEAFLAVANGSCEPPVLLECVYNGADTKLPPVLLTAKGITFDSGGLCLKKPEAMIANRGSMAGAAVVLATLKALIELKVKLNVAAVIPLCENMISGQCMKVGDVVCALNGKSIEIEDTDMEGRLMLADALVYGQSVYHPELVVNVATLTHGVELATGGGAFGCFCNEDTVWEKVQQAGALSGDRPWRLPLWNYYQKQITNDAAVDLRNKGSGKSSPCLGAAFLQNFICCDFVHMDITGVGKLAHAHPPPYLEARRMTGRPTRTLIQFLEALVANPPTPPTPPDHN